MIRVPVIPVIGIRQVCLLVSSKPLVSGKIASGIIAQPQGRITQRCHRSYTVRKLSPPARSCYIFFRVPLIRKHNFLPLRRFEQVENPESAFFTESGERSVDHDSPPGSSVNTIQHLHVHLKRNELRPGRQLGSEGVRFRIG
jgi:hypothetical protein